MYSFLSGFLAFLSIVSFAQPSTHSTFLHGALVRGDSTKKELALVFTADEFGEGLSTIQYTLQHHGIKAGFFFTGRFYEKNEFKKQVRLLAEDGHYFGPHSDRHLLYNNWTERDSLLVSRDSFTTDVANNLGQMMRLGLPLHKPQLFIPPYEWWNDTIAIWCKKEGLQLLSFTPGIRTNADYTWPQLGTAYKSSDWILQWLENLVHTKPQKLNGAVLLIHAGTDPRRKDKLYNRLDEIIILLKSQGFSFRRIDNLFGFIH